MSECGLAHTCGSRPDELGYLSVQCPGTLRVQAAQIRMVGPSHVAHEMNTWAEPAPMDEQYIARWPDGSPVVEHRFQIDRADGAVVTGTTDTQGRAQLQKDIVPTRVRFRLQTNH